MSNILNEVKEALTGHHPNNSAKAGPHRTNVANKADPRVGSDMDHRNNPTGIMDISTSGYGSSTTCTTTDSTNVGPHSSNMMNKMDPRVGSDADCRNNPTSAIAGPHSGHGANDGYDGTTARSTFSGTGFDGANVGPHKSSISNKADPRVDSDRDGSMTVGNPGYGPSMTGNTGYGGSTTGTSGLGCGTTGHHTTGASGLGCGTTGSHATSTSGSGCGTIGHHATTTSGAGGTTSTSGPHKSNVLNKLDPRVDSDLDGSKTVGSNNTY